MYVSWEDCCRTPLYPFALCLLIYSNGGIKLTMEMSTPTTHIVTVFLLKAAEIKMLNQISRTIQKKRKSRQNCKNALILSADVYMWYFQCCSSCSYIVSCWADIHYVLHLSILLCAISRKRRLLFWFLLYFLLLKTNTWMNKMTIAVN